MNMPKILKSAAATERLELLEVPRGRNPAEGVPEAHGTVQRESSAPMAIAPAAQQGIVNRQSELKAG